MKKTKVSHTRKAPQKINRNPMGPGKYIPKGKSAAKHHPKHKKKDGTKKDGTIKKQNCINKRQRKQRKQRKQVKVKNRPIKKKLSAKQTLIKKKVITREAIKRATIVRTSAKKEFLKKTKITKALSKKNRLNKLIRKKKVQMIGATKNFQKGTDKKTPVASEKALLFKRPLVIAISGTPGTGKTTLARLIEKEFGILHLDVNSIINEYSLSEGYDPIRRCEIVDTGKLKRALVQLISNSKKPLIIDSHMSHYLPKRYVDLCIITICNPKTLKGRLRKRGYHDAKIRENLDSEIFEVCMNEARDIGHNAFVIDTSTLPSRSAGFEILKMQIAGLKKRPKVNTIK